MQLRTRLTVPALVYGAVAGLSAWDQGWETDVDFGDRLYANECPPAVQLAERWGIGQWAVCGGFDAES